LTRSEKENTMWHRWLFVALIGLVGSTGLVIAQGGGYTDSIAWDTGSPAGDSLGNMTGSGTYTNQTGWSTDSGNMTAYFPDDFGSDGSGAGVCYRTPLSFTVARPNNGSWTATTLSGLPEATYNVFAIATFTDGAGNYDSVVATLGSTTVGGGKKKEPPGGTVPITQGPSANNGTVTASGTFQANKGWMVQLGTFQGELVPGSYGFFGSFTPDPKGKVLFDKKVVIDAQKGTWQSSIANVPNGTYKFAIRMTVASIVDDTVTQDVFSSKKATVP
jgi:hypothetical protein